MRKGWWSNGVSAHGLGVPGVRKGWWSNGVSAYGLRVPRGEEGCDQAVLFPSSVLRP